MRDPRLRLIAVGAAALALASGGAALAVQLAHASSSNSAREAVSISIGDLPIVERSIVANAIRATDAGLLRDVRLGDPPAGVVPLEGYPGDRWLYIGIPVGADTDIRVMQDWEAANLAGAVRNAAVAEGVAAPFGYSAIGIRADGTTIAPVEIVLGALPEEAVIPINDLAAETSRITEVATSFGLTVRDLEFRGSDAAPVVTLSTDEPPAQVIGRWIEVLQGMMGELPKTPWYVEIDDSAGDPIRALANSPVAGGATGWTRPELRNLEVELGHD